MASLTKQAYEAMSDKERELLLKVVSTDNVLRGMPSFQEWCAAQHRVQRTAFGTGWRVWFANLFIRLGWWLAGKGSR